MYNIHLYVESKKYNKLVNETKKETHRYRKQMRVTSRESEVERNNTQVGGTNSYYGII